MERASAVLSDLLSLLSISRQHLPVPLQLFLAILCRKYDTPLARPSKLTQIVGAVHRRALAFYASVVTLDHVGVVRLIERVVHL